MSPQISGVAPMTIDDNGHTAEERGQIARLTGKILRDTAALEEILGGAGGDSVRWLRCQLRETVRRATAIEVHVDAADYESAATPSAERAA